MGERQQPRETEGSRKWRPSEPKPLTVPELSWLCLGPRKQLLVSKKKYLKRDQKSIRWYHNGSL